MVVTNSENKSPKERNLKDWRRREGQGWFAIFDFRFLFFILIFESWFRILGIMSWRYHHVIPMSIISCCNRCYNNNMEAGTLYKAVRTCFNNCPMAYLFILPCCEVTQAQIYTETIRSLVQSPVGLFLYYSIYVIVIVCTESLWPLHCGSWFLKFRTYSRAFLVGALDNWDLLPMQRVWSGVE